MMSDVLHRIKRYWIKLRFKPIRVFCMHHVCAAFDAESMHESDWMNIETFKIKVRNVQMEGVQFISLSEAYRHICDDWWRYKKYAVLTFDDGYASLKEILPWLNEQHIPVTLFVNGKYLDGKSYRHNPKEKYLTKEDLDQLYKLYPLLTIGSHGWEHNRVTEMTNEQFEQSVTQNVDLLSKHPNYVPFWAYTYGMHTKKMDEYLQKRDIVPVYIAGEKNYNNNSGIDRELLK